jgi:hypothetical protein
MVEHKTVASWPVRLPHSLAVVDTSRPVMLGVVVALGADGTKWGGVHPNVVAHGRQPARGSVLRPARPTDTNALAAEALKIEGES